MTPLDIEKAIREAVAAEREACAVLCEKESESLRSGSVHMAAAAFGCACAIRGRNEKSSTTVVIAACDPVALETERCAKLCDALALRAKEDRHAQLGDGEGAVAWENGRIAAATDLAGAIRGGDEP